MMPNYEILHNEEFEPIDVDVIMPMLGKGERMQGMQDTCKPLYLLPNGEPLFMKALKSLKKYNIQNLILVVREEYEEDFKVLMPQLEGLVERTVEIVPCSPTETQVDSFLIGLEVLENGDRYLPPQSSFPVISLDCDIYGELPVPKIPEGAVGSLFGFKHDNPNKSYIRYNGKRVTDIAEKKVISDMAVFGAYMFYDLTAIKEAYNKVAYRNMSDLYKFFLDQNYPVYWEEVKGVKNYGTLEEWKTTIADVDKTYSAILFDFDGTLFDTKELNFKAYQLAYFDLGVTITKEMFAKTDGLSVYDFNHAMGVTCDVEKLKDLKQKYYSEMSLYAKPNKYLLNLISNHTGEGDIKTALVTTARLCNILPLLQKYDLKFDVMVTQEDVDKHKPNPECYKLAMERLGKEPRECLAFEDSRPGFVAAREAGIDCVMVKEFQDDCLRDMSGGSDATTKLLFLNGKLVVKKEAFGEKNAQRLYNQFEKLMEEKDNDHYIHVLEYSGEPKRGWFTYTMPYRPAPTAYEYINKIKVIPEICKLLDESARRVDDYDCDDIREFCYKTYIEPGMEIYAKVTGKELPKIYQSYEHIPEFVNKFQRTTYHGDSTLENVLVERDGTLLFIDPVPDGNAVEGIVHDFSKIGQSLTGYEAIRDGIDFDYRIERSIFDECAWSYLTDDEYKSLKFHTACLLFRRLKHQIEQNPALVPVYGEIAWNLLDEFARGKYSWKTEEQNV